MSPVRDMTRGRPAKLILTFALPLMLGNMFQQLYTIVDTIVVGRVVGIQGLAAIGAADWIYWLVLSMILGFTHGFSILVAQTFGAVRLQELRKVVAMSFWLALLIAVVTTAISLPLIIPVLRLLNTPAVIISNSALYLRIIFSGLFTLTAYQMFSAVLRALGDSQTPLRAMALAALLNIGLDLLFVVVFGWGIAGAAVATVLAQFFASLYCLRALRLLPVLKMQKTDWVLDRPIISQLVRLGSPLALQNVIIALGGLVVQSVINGFGVIFVAGFTAVMKLYGLLELAATALGFAVSTFTGQNLGARQVLRIRRGMHDALKMGLATAITLSVIILAFGRQIVRLFISGSPHEVAAVVDIAYRYLVIMSLFLFILYLLHVYRSALQGMGDTIIPMLSGVVEMIMRVAVVLLLPPLVGRTGVFYVEVAAWSGAMILLAVFAYRRLRQLNQDPEKEAVMARKDF